MFCYIARHSRNAQPSAVDLPDGRFMVEHSEMLSEFKV